MPPQVPARRAGHTGEIVQMNPMERVLGFVALEPIQAALDACDFDLAEETRITVGHIRSEDPKVSLGGLRHFRNGILKDVYEANGLTGKVQQTERIAGDGGEEVTRTVTTTTLLTRMNEERGRATDDPNRFERYGAGHQTAERDDDERDGGGGGAGPAETGNPEPGGGVGGLLGGPGEADLHGDLGAGGGHPDGVGAGLPGGTGDRVEREERPGVPEEGDLRTGGTEGVLPEGEAP